MSFSTPQKAGQSDRAHCFFLKVQGHQRQGLNDAVLVAAGLSTRSLLSHQRRPDRNKEPIIFLPKHRVLIPQKIGKIVLRRVISSQSGIPPSQVFTINGPENQKWSGETARQPPKMFFPCFSTIQSRFTLQPHQHGHPCLRSPFAIEMEITDPTLTNTASWSKASP